MQIDLQKLEKSEVKLTVKLSAEEMAPFEEKAAKELQNQVKVDGFRTGHIPLDVLKNHIGEQAFLGAVLDIAVSESYEKAVHEKDLRPVAFPKISITAHSPLEFEAVIALLPEVSFKKDPKSIKLKRKQVEVEEKDVHEVITNFLARSKKWQDTARAAQKGDRAEIDFDGFDEGGVPLEGTSSKNHPVVLGSDSLIPGFEDEIVGMNLGEEKDFWITFPSDYHSAAFQSKKVKFHIKLNRLEEEGAAQEANDDWAKEVSGDPTKTLVDMKGEIKTELHKQKQYQEDARLEEEFLKSLMEQVEAEVPPALIDREIDFIVERMKKDAERRKQPWEEKEEMRKELHKPALEQVLIRLGLEKLFEMENPDVTDADIQAEVDRMLGQYPEEFKAMLRERYAPGTEGHESAKGVARFKKLVQGHISE